MTNRNLHLWKTTIFIAILVFGGCKKQVSTLTEPAPEPTIKPDTSFKEPEIFDKIDTSDEVSFNEAELEAEFKRKVNENLRTVYFDFNSYSLSHEARDILAVAGNFLMEHAGVRVLIEGHCDERGSSEYNMGLGENRAKAVKDYLINYGIAPIKTEITSWGKEHPVTRGCTNDECHSKNRRAEFKVLAH